MTSENFSYWLQGYAEICGECPTPEQWEIIKEHLALVFNKVTPNRTFCGAATIFPCSERGFSRAVYKLGDKCSEHTTLCEPIAYPYQMPDIGGVPLDCFMRSGENCILDTGRIISGIGFGERPNTYFEWPAHLVGRTYSPICSVEGCGKAADFLSNKCYDHAPPEERVLVTC